MVTRRDFLKVSAASGVLVSTGMHAQAQKKMQAVLPDENFADEEARKIPVYAEADIVVVGGSSAAVSAAAAAAAKGRKVFLVTQMPYLGDDICGTLRYRAEKPLFNATTLSQKVFIYKGNEYPSPLHVKTELENELLYNNIPFLYSSYLTDIITGANGEPAGVVIANRSGRQAIKAPVIIDATQTAVLAAMAGAKMTPFTSGISEFYFTTVGNNSAKTAAEIASSRVLPVKVKSPAGEYDMIEYLLRLPLPDNSYASLAGAEQTARSLTWDKEIVDSADLLWFTPSQNIVSASRLTEIPSSLTDISGKTFLSDKGIWVLGPSADMGRDVAEKLFSDAENAMSVGAYIGECIANETKSIEQPAAYAVSRPKAKSYGYGSVKEIMQPIRPRATVEWIDSPRGSLPVLGRFDVIVSGGGVAGAPAAISAARHGARTLLVEYLHGLGGLGTFGMIGVYWDGYREGFSREVDKGVRDMAPADHPRQKKDWGSRWDYVWKAEWLRSKLLEAGGEAWFGVIGCGALIENNVIKGIIVATPYGRGVVLAHTVIDSSGSADIAIAAGAAYDYTGAKSIAVQGAGLPKVSPADYYNNTDWLFIDDTDILDVTRVFVQGKKKYRGLYDVGKIPQTRERRRVLGEYTVTVSDIIQKRLFKDVISYHVSSFDTHGTTVDPFFTLSPPLERHTIYDASVPFRSLLPKGMEGIMVTGLGTSAHRDAMPVIRMQSCLQSQGYSVGYVAALAARDKLPLRKIDIRKVQKYLVEIGNLPARIVVKETVDPFVSRAVKAAAESVTDDYQGLDILLSIPAQSIPLLKKKMKQTADVSKQLVYSAILCIMGDGEFADILANEIDAQKQWDKGWHYTGMGQFGFSMSRLDGYIIALGNSKRADLLPAILSKAVQLKPESYYSHFRSVALACESIGSAGAAETLYGLLNMPGIQGNDLPDMIAARNRVVPDTQDVSLRNKALKEFHLAQALYCCGDKNGLGRSVLSLYAHGLEGHYRRTASELLFGKK